MVKLKLCPDLKVYANGELFAKVAYFVEATSCERSTIWEKYQYAQCNPMPVITLGNLHEYEIVYNFHFVTMMNQIICFYECQSQANYFELAEAWIVHHINPKTLDDRRAITEANNFHNVVNELKRLNEKKA